MAKALGSNVKKYALIAAVVVVVAVVLFYFIIISPIFVAKPNIAKPELGTNIGINNINWLANEVGAYKLHSDISGQPPTFQFILSDTNQTFDIIVTGNIPSTLETVGVTNPDLKITTDSATFRELYDAADFNSKIKELNDAGRVSIELIKTTSELALKGYKGVYDELGF